MTISEKTKYYLERIKTNSDLNCFVSLFDEDALSKSKEADKIINESNKGKLFGKIIAVKDVIAIKNQKLTACSKILKDYTAVYNATVIDKILSEGAIVIGKTSCDEFAMGSSNENSAFGPVLNPVNKSRVPGGSSGGSAVAVAADLCDMALGSDTGGSVRQPAAFCGVYGLKPTYGRVSRYGLIAFASSFDTIGTFAKNTKDLAEISEVIFGHDVKDSTSVNIPVPDLQSEIIKGIEGLKVGIPSEYFRKELNIEIREAIIKKINLLKNAGCEILEISLPHTEYAIATYYILITAEASSNLSRYDGARYGFRNPDAKTLEEMYKMSRTNGFGKEVKRRIMLGTYVLSSGYYDAYYNKAQRVRRLIQNDFLNAFKEVDIIVTPTTPYTAFKIGDKISDPLEMYLGDIYTTSVNLAGIPGINIPIGIDQNGLPIGMQILSGHFREDLLFRTAGFLENN